MIIDNRLTASNDVLKLIELNKLLAERQQQLLVLQDENNRLRKMNSGLKNRLQLLLRSVWTMLQARKNTAVV